jgi:hypothetical protein
VEELVVVEVAEHEGSVRRYQAALAASLVHVFFSKGTVTCFKSNFFQLYTVERYDCKESVPQFFFFNTI